MQSRPALTEGLLVGKQVALVKFKNICISDFMGTLIPRFVT